jgi:hypothetical protein
MYLSTQNNFCSYPIRYRMREDTAKLDDFGFSQKCTIFERKKKYGNFDPKDCTKNNIYGARK